MTWRKKSHKKLFFADIARVRKERHWVASQDDDGYLDSVRGLLVPDPEQQVLQRERMPLNEKKYHVRRGVKRLGRRFKD